MLLNSGFTSLSNEYIIVPNITAATSMNIMNITILITLLRNALSRWKASTWIDGELARRVDETVLVALRLADKREKELMNLGLVKFYDPESSRTVWIDTGSAAVRRMADARYAEHERKVDTTMKRYGIDMATLWTGEDFVKPLKNLLARRS